MKEITLYRPIGEKELVLIAESDFQEFPPRLDWQPIFYPVLNEEYAIEIASKWNTVDDFGNFLGFVTKFNISEEEYKKHKVECVGASLHQELWVKSEELSRFNSEIIGAIEIVKVFVGEQFKETEYKVVSDIIKTIKN